MPQRSSKASLPQANEVKANRTGQDHSYEHDYDCLGKFTYFHLNPRQSFVFRSVASNHKQTPEAWFLVKLNSYNPPENTLLVDKFHKVVGMSVDKLKTYIHGRNACYLNLSLSGGNGIFALNIVRKIEGVSEVSTFRLQTVERMKSSDFCTQSLKREVWIIRTLLVFRN